jgi:hypothetical protein
MCKWKEFPCAEMKKINNLWRKAVRIMFGMKKLGGTLF